MPSHAHAPPPFPLATLRALGVDMEMARRVHARYPVKLSEYVLEQIKGAPDGALARQALPSAEELAEEEGVSADPFKEGGAASCCYGVKRRYPDRILVMAHDQCAMNCRHCTRKGGLLKNAEIVRTPPQIADAVAYVKAHPPVREVLLSGGDPLLLPDARLLALVRAFAGLPQVDAVRIGTRAPATLPSRVTPPPAQKLRQGG
ncbi:MAG: radical SAM protein, partial [Kiritimatiellaeota bacterium]|nr:radical SAM protein [Kiritimatiellota bacterium]